jgi:hypothetical protein
MNTDKLRTGLAIIGAIGACLGVGATWHGGCSYYAASADVRALSQRVTIHDTTLERIEAKLDVMIQLLRSEKGCGI